MRSPDRHRSTTGKPAAGTRAVSTAPIRCAIYTRKSTEEGLEQAFNSLDAQREACAAYIASQKHEGWVLSPELYDDGGFSGGNLQRPGLAALMAEVEAGRVQVIVVYKVDRLTRSLADFAKIVEVLDAKGASFVSVTQSFNTTTSMGRLTLNVLLSFAQFEREVTGERIRDKIAASKKKGMWMGGPIPLGYDVRDRKLVINEAEAATVRHVFERYQILSSVRHLATALTDEGVVTKLRPMRSGRVTGGTPFGRGGLVHLLRNAVYIGEVHHRGSVYAGEHDPIIDRELWDHVQSQLDGNIVERKSRSNERHPSLLAGLVYDGLGRRMTPTHANKGPRRFRYYITHSDTLVAGGLPQWRLPAHDLEQIVLARATCWLGTIGDSLITEHPAADAAMLGGVRHRAATMATVLTDGPASNQRDGLRQLVRRVEVGDAEVAITIRPDAILDDASLPDRSNDIVLTAPAVRVRRGDDVRLIMGGVDAAANRDERLIALVAEARRANAALLNDASDTLDVVASANGHSRKHFSQLVRLAYLAPDIVGRILDGTQPPTLTRARLLATTDVPLGWAEQRNMFGFSAAA